MGVKRGGEERMTWCRNMNNEWINKQKEIKLKIKKQRILELEEKAKRIFLEHTDWNYVLDMLDDDEKKEYDKLYKDLFEAVKKDEK
tara:strand:- start:229 stop:486 length:258 start_codon:yes stop_codon:yes gene_type:complete